MNILKFGNVDGTIIEVYICEIFIRTLLPIKNSF